MFPLIHPSFFAHYASIHPSIHKSSDLSVQLLIHISIILLSLLPLSNVLFAPLIPYTFTSLSYFHFPLSWLHHFSQLHEHSYVSALPNYPALLPLYLYFILYKLALCVPVNLDFRSFITFPFL